jgi:DNA end-binding protein Ku
MRGKEHLVLIRPFGKGLMLHTVYYSDELRPAEEVDQAENEPVREAELTLAKRLIDELTEKEFDPSKYHDHYRERVLEVAQQKVAGQQVTEAPPEPRRGQVIDLMSALKASLEKRGATVPEDAETSPKSESESPPRAPRASSERRRAGGRK